MKTKIFLVLICTLVICNVINAQSITNTLGSSGVFTIKDASNNYLSLNQSTGQVNILRTLRLENTTSTTTGVIFKGVDRFIHNYGTQNIFFGVNSGNFTMTGGYNTSVGYFTLQNNTSGTTNSAFGYNSLSSNTTGISNSAFGTYSLLLNVSGSGNTSIGFNTLRSNSTGMENTAVGYDALNNNTTGLQNTAVGYDALRNNTAGWQNTAVGHHSLRNNTGNYNTALGYNAGSTITTGSNLTCLGIDAAPSSPTALDQITLGNGFVTSLRCNVQTITSLSDIRDKKNIEELSLGLDFITKLKPRQFNWDKREWYDGNVSDGSKMKEAPTAGFIAQELDEAQTTGNAEWLNLVLKDNPEKWEATYGNLLPVVVKAVQELKEENDELKSKNEKLEERLAKYEEMQSMIVKKMEELESKNSEVKNVKLSEK